MSWIRVEDWGEVIRQDLVQLQLIQDMTLDMKLWRSRITVEDLSQDYLSPLLSLVQICSRCQEVVLQCLQVVTFPQMTPFACLLLTLWVETFLYMAIFSFKVICLVDLHFAFVSFFLHLLVHLTIFYLLHLLLFHLSI